jgi:hypothetical protein
MKFNAVCILMDGASGVYIPRDFAEGYTMSRWGLDPESWEVKTCLEGPEAEGYWDAWVEILERAEFHDNGNVWRLHQDGDLWAICEELMTDYERENFFGLEV